MNVMLDTHFILWYAKADPRLPNGVLEIIENDTSVIAVSEVSLLEIAIKHAKNPSSMPYSAEDLVDFCEANHFMLRSITRDVILAYGSLNFEKVGDLHRDPFDRLLIAHVKAEGFILATHDRLLSLYDEPCVAVYV